MSEVSGIARHLTSWIFMPKKSVGLTAPHPDYEPAPFGIERQGHCRILSAGVAFTFRHATGKSSQKRKGRDLQTLPTLLDIGYLPLFYIAAYLYCRIPIFPYCHIGAFLYSCIYIYGYTNIHLCGLPCRPYSGTSPFRLLPWYGLQLSSTIVFETSALPPWRWSQVARLYHGISYCPWTFSDGLPLYLSLPFFGSGSFAGTTSSSQVSGPDSGTVIFFSMHSVCFSWYR